MLLAEGPELEHLSTTMMNGLVGDQSWPTVRENAGPGLYETVDQTSFVCEVALGLSSQEEKQELKEDGCRGYLCTEAETVTLLLLYPTCLLGHLLLVLLVYLSTCYLYYLDLHVTLP